MHAYYHECMAQLTIRIDDRLADEVKDHARRAGRSVNAWVLALLTAATDPDLADSEVERLRARLARAGLLLVPEGPPPPQPDAEEVRRAREEAGRSGPMLSDLIIEGRD